MAPRQSTKKSSASPHKAPPRKPPAKKPQYEWPIDSAELRRARKAAILQLKMGRLAHVIGIASALVLAVTAIIAYLLENWELLIDAPEYVTVLKWIIPLIAGAIVAAVALALKWEPYMADRNEPHFIMSFASLIVPLFFIALIMLDELEYLAIGRPDWLYPASLLGICFTEISLAMTWEGTSRRKSISMTAAVLPPVILVFPMIFSFSAVELASILPMAYLGGAVLFHLSGSMLHIIASSTTVQQREVLKASDSKLREQLLDIENKRKVLEYREDGLRSRESDLETYERRLSQELAAIEEKKVQAAAMEAEAEQRLLEVHEAREELRKREGELEGKLDSVRLQLSEIERQRRELDKLSKAITAREEKVHAEEREASTILLDAQAQVRELENGIAELKAEESSFESRRKDLEDFETSQEEKEKALAAREATLDIRDLEIIAAKEKLGKVSEEKAGLKNIEQQLLMKQEALSETEIALRKQEEALKERMEKAERFAGRVDKQMNVLVEKESMLLSREKLLADNEARLRTDLERLNAQLADAEHARAAVAEREKEYLGLTEETRTKASALTSREEEITRKMSALERRETKIKELEERLSREREQMNSKLRTLLEKEKDLHAKETDIGLKTAELKAMERSLLESVQEVEEVRAEAPDEAAIEHAKALDLREKRLREKEQEMKSRLYQREKEMEKREKALQAHLRKDIEAMEEEVEEEYAEEKVKTGIERLDDLLLGGLPFGSNITFVGPPFIGKEVAALLLAAEGLRKGVPVVFITTSHPPSELARDMAPILPTFMEFDQIGLVRWVDASGLPSEDVGPMTSGAKTIRTAGPGDLKGIIEAVDTFAEEFRKQEHAYFRLIYMSLSITLTNAEEKSAFQFLQALSGKVRQEDAIAIYAVERGMHTEQQLEAIQHQTTGAIQFKTDKHKTLLSVQGVGDVQTRDWVEYRHTNKALMIGAFSLERIR